jgi:hypothetical protein
MENNMIKLRRTVLGGLFWVGLAMFIMTVYGG